MSESEFWKNEKNLFSPGLIHSCFRTASGIHQLCHTYFVYVSKTNYISRKDVPSLSNQMCYFLGLRGNNANLHTRSCCFYIFRNYQWACDVLGLKMRVTGHNFKTEGRKSIRGRIANISLHVTWFFSLCIVYRPFGKWKEQRLSCPNGERRRLKVLLKFYTYIC